MVHNSPIPIISSSYFCDILTAKILVTSEKVLIDHHERFVKRSCMNRCFIAGANGKILLSVPICGHRRSSKLVKDLQISTSYDWARHHYRTLESVYKNSPFYDFYEADLVDLYSKSYKYLIDLNMATMTFIFKSLNLPLNRIIFVHEQACPYKDFRASAFCSFTNTLIQPYIQIFQERNGFLSNLSVLDLLFSQGQYAIRYLSL